jgi:hypothetical protein
MVICRARDLYSCDLALRVKGFLITKLLRLPAEAGTPGCAVEKLGLKALKTTWSALSSLFDIWFPLANIAESLRCSCLLAAEALISGTLIANTSPLCRESLSKWQK